MTDRAIVVDGLRRCYGKVVALDGPSFDVTAGQPTAFGGAIPVLGTSYVNYLIPGIFAQSVAFGAMGTAVGSGRCSLAAPALDGADRGVQPVRPRSASNRVCALASGRAIGWRCQSVRTETAGGTGEFRAAPLSTLPQADDARLTTANHRLGAESLQSRVPGTKTGQEIGV